MSYPRFGLKAFPPDRGSNLSSARVSLLTPSWCLMVIATAVIMIGFEDDHSKDRSHNRHAMTDVLGQTDRPIQKIAFSPDGTRLAALEGKSLLIFRETEERSDRATIGVDDLDIRSFVFDPQGHTVALGNVDGSIRFITLETGQDSGRITLDEEPVLALAFSPDGRCIASAQGSGRLTLWEVETGSLRLDLKASDAPILALAFSPDGRWLASTHADGLVVVWDAETGEPRTSVASRPGLLRPLIFSPDGGTLWWLNRKRHVLKWDLSADSNAQVVSAPAEEMVLMPDGKSLLVRVDEERVWQLDAETLQVELPYRFPGRLVTAMDISRDGTRIALGELETVAVAELAQFVEKSSNN
ncbi:WD40 repeat domain-containing protein [Tautonia rosea]|uniref:WD40 repeat domain-containing protein n=1 Tax=Tautonia rosea TaxID=2728037 RepID=UPI00147569D2|nr:LpqB family beta-propeller domain-containing protein [Tautonia rosea]